MENLFFIHFGPHFFKKFIAIMLHNIPQFPEMTVFNSFKLDEKIYFIDEVYINWSYLLLKVDGKLFRCGFQNNNYIQDVKYFNEFENEIKTLSSSLESIFVSTLNGDLYFYLTTENSFKKLAFTNYDIKVKDIAIGDLHKIILTNDNQVYFLKKNENIIPFSLKSSILQVACGKEHALMLSNNGHVFSYGQGSRGQLGHGEMRNLEKPTLLEALDGIVIKKIAAGGWHSAAISNTGDLYMWGWNESGQLGMPCKEKNDSPLPSEIIKVISFLPTCVEFENNLNVIDVSCGSRHSAAITEDFRVWTWGWNKYRQLGHKNNTLYDRPEPIILPENFIPCKIICAFWDTLIKGCFKM